MQFIFLKANLNYQENNDSVELVQDKNLFPRSCRKYFWAIQKENK